MILEVVSSAIYVFMIQDAIRLIGMSLFFGCTMQERVYDGEEEEE